MMVLLESASVASMLKSGPCDAAAAGTAADAAPAGAAADAALLAGRESSAKGMAGTAVGKLPDPGGDSIPVGAGDNDLVIRAGTWTRSPLHMRLAEEVRGMNAHLDDAAVGTSSAPGHG